MAQEILTAYATQNFWDAWNLHSAPDMLVHGPAAAVGCHMTTSDDLWTVVDMATVYPARIMQLPKYGLAVGSYADLVVLDSDFLLDAMTRIVPRVFVSRRSVLTAKTHDWQHVFGP